MEQDIKFPFTYDKDLDIEILSHVDDETLKAICLSSKYAVQLCNNYRLWSNKILNLYPDFPIDSIKPVDYKHVYNILSKKQIFKGEFTNFFIWNAFTNHNNKEINEWIDTKVKFVHDRSSRIRAKPILMNMDFDGVA